jgi:hypothetical protein
VYKLRKTIGRELLNDLEEQVNLVGGETKVDRILEYRR